MEQTKDLEAEDMILAPVLSQTRPGTSPEPQLSHPKGVSLHVTELQQLR